MNIDIAERLHDALARHVSSTGQANFTARELHEIFGSGTTADGMEQIRLLLDRGHLIMCALYVDAEGSVHELDAATYAAAIADGAFTDPLSGARIDGCIELSPFWSYVSERASAD